MSVLILLHRYIGAVAGLLMVLWCLSGFVMMYQSYPHLAPADRLPGLAPLRVSATEAANSAWAVSDGQALSGFRLEMMAGRPMLEMQLSARRRQAFDLRRGAPLETVPAEDVLRVADAYAAAHGVRGRAEDLGLVDVDQWTLDGINRGGPLHHIRFDDPARTELYVSQHSGQAAQATTARTRLLAWLGAIPHWLYPTQLRKNPQLWDQVVVWSSLVGVFLTVVGLYIGIARFRRYKNGRWSPYRGWFYWHHVTGLLFGVLTLTWVASGLFTMNPFGFLDTDVGMAERSALAGTVSGDQMKRFLALTPTLAAGDLATLETTPLAGRLYVLATGRDGSTQRLDDQGRPAPLAQAEVAAALHRLPGPKLASLERLDREDAYYYSGFERKAVFPVYRARLADAQATTFYIDAEAGRLVEALDNTERQSRWLRTGLHDIDFFAGLRARPVWDVVVLVLLAGVTGVCMTGAWLGLKRIGRDIQALRQWLAARSGTT